VPKTVIALVVIGLVWIGYMAWPLYELSALVRAIDARDVSTVARYVNFDRVRASLTEQIASGYIRRSGVQPGPLAQQAIVVGLSVADTFPPGDRIGGHRLSQPTRPVMAPLAFRLPPARRPSGMELASQMPHRSAIARRRSSVFKTPRTKRWLSVVLSTTRLLVRSAMSQSIG
jgi:hypothetical protein